MTARSAIGLTSGTVSGLVSMPVATLIEEVLKAMFISQIKRTAAIALAAACIATGAGIIAVGAAQREASSPKGDATAARVADRQAVKADGGGVVAQPAATPSKR